MNSIIIPHRKRLPALTRCVNSILNSPAVIDNQFEIIVVHNGADVPSFPGVTVIANTDDMPVFNKCRLLNQGIDAAQGDILTFLDCDMVVGSRWLDAVRVDWDAVMRVCYRVRNINGKRFESGVWRWEALPKAYEAYGEVQNDRRYDIEPVGLPWGNSQFSIHRKWLGDLRYDENYIGRCYEDLDFLVRFQSRYKRNCTAIFYGDEQHGLLHVEHEREPDWEHRPSRTENRRRFIAATRAAVERA
jgi:glycosyltransferase involved in cell wall biosynthesis